MMTGQQISTFVMTIDCIRAGVCTSLAPVGRKTKPAAMSAQLRVDF